MWVFLNDAFLSIVADRDDADRLLVRGRLPGDIERAFPDAQVRETRDADYRFRAFIPRSAVASRLAEAVDRIDYPNFKSSVRQDWRHDLYLSVWQVMARAQRAASKIGKPAA